MLMDDICPGRFVGGKPEIDTVVFHHIVNAGGITDLHGQLQRLVSMYRRYHNRLQKIVIYALRSGDAQQHLGAFPQQISLFKKVFPSCSDADKFSALPGQFHLPNSLGSGEKLITQFLFQPF